MLRTKILVPKGGRACDIHSPNALYLHQLICMYIENFAELSVTLPIAKLMPTVTGKEVEGDLKLSLTAQ